MYETYLHIFCNDQVFTYLQINLMIKTTQETSYKAGSVAISTQHFFLSSARQMTQIRTDTSINQSYTVKNPAHKAGSREG